MSKRVGKQERVSLEPYEGDSQEDFQFEKEKKSQEVVTIKINLESYQNIVGFFPTSDIKTYCSFDGKNVGETSWKPITDDEYLHIGETFSFTIDRSSAKEIDKLISLPMLLTVSQATGILDANLYDNLQINQEFGPSTNLRSLDSIINMYESFTDHKLLRSDFADQFSRKSKRSKKIKTEKNPKKSKDGSTYRPDSIDSVKISFPNQSILLQSEPTSEDQDDPAVYGMCTIDFLPLFKGEQSFSETLLIRPVRKYDDEKMISHKAHPKIIATVSADGDLNFVGATIMNITVESIYNIPSLIRPDVDYKINVMLPKVVTRKIPILFTNPHYTSHTVADTCKCWPSMPKIGLDANTMKYASNVNNDEIVNGIGEDVRPYLKKKGPRLLFNMMKRNLLLEDGWKELSDYIRTFRKVILEISVHQRGHRKSNSNLTRPEKEPSVPSLKFTNETVKKPKQSASHFMAVVDVSSLLDPGVTRVRVASPLSSYSGEEALKYCSQDDVLSTTIRKMFPSRDVLIKPKDKTSRMKEKDSEKSEKSSMKSKDKEPVVKDLKSLLPPKPEAEPKPEPLVPILNEQGKPCFIVLEIELSNSITPRRDIEDLRDSMHELLQKKLHLTPKAVLCDCITKSYYRELLKEIIQDIEEKFQRFSNEYPNYKVLSDKTSDFMNFLQSIGVYQAYTSSITKATTLLATNKFNFGETKNGKGYQKLIGEVFVHLMSEMNDTLNELACHGAEPTREETISEKRFLYAKEALEMGDTNLADRYLLDRICSNKENPDHWFDYGVYFLELGNADRAFECVQQALLKNPNHRSSLMAVGILMDNKGQKDEAEMCFLNLMISNPKWLEGWVVLYLFYWKHDCYEGMDVALEMANKQLDDIGNCSTSFGDFAWTSNICPKTIFFRTAMELLKMRLYDWAEIALSEELSAHCGLVHYLLAAICYYKKLHSHALEHIAESKKLFGSNYAVASLSGHCLLALNRSEEAKAEYDHAMGEYERPNDMHLVYLNLVKILESCGQDQEARKFTLLTCKYNPSPYTWLKAGQFYLQENDLLSAEECFSEGNVRDPRHAELWGYLCLVNLKLDRLQEADLCFQQAIQNRLPNCDLLKKIQEIRNLYGDN